MRLSILIPLLFLSFFSSRKSVAAPPDPLNGGFLYAAYDTVVAYNTKPGYLAYSGAFGGSCSSYQYEWQQSANNGPWVSIGTGDVYPASAPPLVVATRIRVKVTCGSEIAYSNEILFIISGTPPTGPASANYIRTEEIWRPGITDSAAVKNLPIGEKMRTTTYYDGLNRPVQTVQQKYSGSAKDVVTFTDYDTLGNEKKQYLPYAYAASSSAAESSDGSWKPSAPTDQPAFYETLYPGQPAYQQLDYELSPQKRGLKKLPAGSSWVGSSRGAEDIYELNTVQDSVVIWRMGVNNYPAASGYYTAGQLFKKISKDEQGNRLIVYTDKNESTVLSKSEFAATAGTAHVNWLCTYQVYDDFGLHRYTITPKATDLLMRNSWAASTTDIWTELCFRYEYDAARRMVLKQIPGAAPLEMVYDVRNRLAFSRDGNQLAQGKWLAIFYDQLDRPMMKALYTSTATRATLQQQYLTTLNSYPSTIPAASLYPLVYLFYDKYDASAHAVVTADLGVPTALSGHWPDANTGVSNQLRNLPTGWKARVLGAPTDQWVSTTLYYNLKGRNIQRITEHVTGGKSITTELFDFSGKLLGRYEHHYNPRSTATPQTGLLTKIGYDQAGRIASVQRGYGINPFTMRQVATLAYNDLGQLQTKTLGNGLETLAYKYNIRGWLKSMNADYFNDAGNTLNNFAFELSYDNSASAMTGATYTSTLYNGNIAGTLWRSRGDGAKRKYDFTYDKANRLLKASFLQNTTGTWNNTTIDYTVQVGNGTDPLTAYDANGNIRALQQKGLRLSSNTSPVIDNLQYEYMNNGVSNRLKFVKDATLVTSKELSDFTESAANYNANLTGTADYTHDANGNLTSDANKSITAITYNVLNLPQTITLTGGTISYLYDINGKKLEKKVTDNSSGATKTTVTHYADGFIYINDTLKQMSYDEGRIRALYKTGQPVNYTFDYFIKDHLGNVRSVLTEQTDFSMYRATLETERDAVENALFSNINTSRARKPVGYPAATAAANEYVARLNAQYPDKRIGPSLVLKVMAGDTVQIGAQAFYKSQAPPKNDNPAPDMLSPLLRAFGFPSQQASGKIAAGVAADATPFNSGFASRFSRIKNRQPEKQGALRPKAYLNYVLFNEQMEMVDDNSGAKQVKEEADKVQTLANDKMTMRSNGYLYVYTSNESYQDVYFDDVTVLLLPGPLLEETHYYPFGLTMTGISTRAAGRMENRHRFGSKELQSMELANGNGLDWYDYDARIYDPQIGRWLNQDPHAEKYSELSPYNFVNNNPLIYVDPTGKDLAIYFEQDANGNWTIRITATYYVKKGDADSKASATDAAEYWNNKSGEYVYRTGSKKKNNEQDYVINFDIKVVEVDDPAAQKRHDMAGDDKALTKDGSSNTYEVVRDSDLNEHGKTSGFMYVKVRKSDMYGQTGPHEIGHSLLMDHSPNSLMNDGQSGDMNLWPSSVQETLEKTIKESDHQSQFDKPGNRFTIHGNLPRGGKVRNNPNHVEK